MAEEEVRLHIGNLSYQTTDDDLQDCFGKFGRLSDHIVIKERDSGRSRGYGFVSFTNAEEADSAQREMDGAELGGRRIRVSRASSRPSGGGGRRDRDMDRGGFRREDQRFGDRGSRDGRFERGERRYEDDDRSYRRRDGGDRMDTRDRDGGRFRDERRHNDYERRDGGRFRDRDDRRDDRRRDNQDRGGDSWESSAPYGAKSADQYDRRDREASEEGVYRD